MAEPKVTIAATPTPTTGDPCPVCADKGGRLEIYSSHTRGKLQVGYTRCYLCKHRPANNKVVRPVTEIKKRRRRKIVS